MYTYDMAHYSMTSKVISYPHKPEPITPVVHSGTSYPLMYMGSNDASERKVGELALKDNNWHGTVTGGGLPVDFEYEIIKNDYVAFFPSVLTLRAMSKEIKDRHGVQPFLVTRKSKAYLNMPAGKRC